MPDLPPLKPLPPPFVPLVDQDGRMRPEWYQFFEFLYRVVNAIRTYIVGL